jgi:hypothetical protein
MGVQVDRPNAPSVDNDFASPLRRLREPGAHQTTSDKRKPGQCASSMAEHFSTVCHLLRSPDQLTFPGFSEVQQNIQAPSALRHRLALCKPAAASTPANITQLGRPRQVRDRAQRIASRPSMRRL